MYDSQLSKKIITTTTTTTITIPTINKHKGEENTATYTDVVGPTYLLKGPVDVFDINSKYNKVFLL